MFKDERCVWKSKKPNDISLYNTKLFAKWSELFQIFTSRGWHKMLNYYFKIILKIINLQFVLYYIIYYYIQLSLRPLPILSIYFSGIYYI